MVLSEIKMLGIYFAYRVDTDYIITEDMIGEFDRKKYLLRQKE